MVYLFEKEESYIILAGILLFVYILSYGNINGLVTKEYPQLMQKSGNLFNIDVSIPTRYAEFFPNEALLTEMTITNLKRIGFSDVYIEYYIEDANGNVISMGSETKSVEYILNYVKEIELPYNIKSGNYMFFAKLTYNDDISISGNPFKIIEKPSDVPKGYYIVMVLILIIFIILMLYEYIKFRKIERLIKKVNEKNLKEHILIRRGG